MNTLEQLPGPLAQRVLERLEVAPDSPPNLETLRLLYAAWCARVPFDNVRKLIHVRAANPGPLPGCDGVDFFENWLRHGTGGTCWSGTNPLYLLLRHLGFAARRGIGTMLVAPHLPPNHATVRVTLEGAEYLVDNSILCGEPLRLDPADETRVAHPAWGVTCTPWDDGTRRWAVHWRPLHLTGGFVCRIEDEESTGADYLRCSEETRGWSPFNYELTARLNVDDEVLGLSFGKEVSLWRDNSVTETECDHERRVQVLVEKLGFSEEIARQLPPDVPTPPPPGSDTAAAHASGDAQA